MRAQPQTTPKPTPGVAPVVAGARTSSAAAVYEGLKAQRRELSDQLGDLQGTRESITGQLEETPAGSAEQKVLQTRLADVDQRIATADQMLATNAIQLAQSAAIPGAVVQRPPVPNNDVPQEAWVMGGLFLVLVMFPLTIAYARRIWRRNAVAVTSFPKDLAERLQRMEQAIEATSLEVERIGEGQRFLTRLFTEGEGTRALGVGAAQPIQRKETKIPDRLP
jgi:hypothetical protein